MKRKCTRCGNPHNEKTGHCAYCSVVCGKNCWHSTPVQSQSERNWTEHVEEYRHEKDEG